MTAPTGFRRALSIGRGRCKSPAMTNATLPVPCPNCGEAQNVTPGDFDPQAEPFGPLTCMVCGHEFTRDEYMTGMKARLAERERPI